MRVLEFAPARRNLRSTLEALLATMHRMALTMDACTRQIQTAVALQQASVEARVARRVSVVRASASPRAAARGVARHRRPIA
jgi:hypothetical protein